jgi:hypothetical protein
LDSAFDALDEALSDGGNLNYNWVNNIPK